MKPKYYGAICSWAAGKEIEYKYSSGEEWKSYSPNNGTSSFSESAEWRVKDDFADLRRAYSEGATIEYKSHRGKWFKSTEPDGPLWVPSIEYRIKDDISIDQWDKHKDIIKEFWSGKEIEYFAVNEWILKTNDYPSFDIDVKYRVRQEPTLEAELKECTPKENTVHLNTEQFRKGQIYNYFVEEIQGDFFFVRIDGITYRSDTFLRDFYTDNFNIDRVKKNKPKMYCRLKTVVDKMVEFSPVVEVNSKRFDDYKKGGWIECKHKTFKEIE